jgi:hypothetical protein
MTLFRRSLALALALALAVPGAALAKTKKKKKKSDDYDESRYKAYGVLVDHESHTYRFDERGNPIPPPEAKKKGKKKKKVSSDEGDGESKPGCDDGADTCSQAPGGDGAPQP